MLKVVKTRSALRNCATFAEEVKLAYEQRSVSSLCVVKYILLNDKTALTLRNLSKTKLNKLIPGGQTIRKEYLVESFARHRRATHTPPN